VPKPPESSIDPEKKDIIERIYFDDRTGYRSVRDTWKNAREIDPNIEPKDVSQWKAELQPRKTPVSGYNSFIANAPFQDFQVELLFISQPKEGKKKKPPSKPAPALICVDTFSKYASVVLLQGEQKGKVNTAVGILEAFNEMGRYERHQRQPYASRHHITIRRNDLEGP